MKKKEKFSRYIKYIFFIFFFIWILIQFISPIVIPSNSIDNLSGLTGFYDNKETINEIYFPINSVYYMGDILCHQKSERSIYINGNQMPFCSRCTAIWFGITLGLIFMVFNSINLDNRFLIIIILGILPLSIDGFGQLIGLWESTTIIRVLTGAVTGIICGLAIGVIIDEITHFKKIRYIK